MSDIHDWLIGESGVYSGTPGKQWIRKGKFEKVELEGEAEESVENGLEQLEERE